MALSAQLARYERGHSDSAALDFLAFARGNWQVFAVSMILAATFSGCLSLILPKRYTATASILISPPAGSDPRASTVVSPVYLESLKTFELVASNTTLFARALERLHIRDRYPGVPIESLKRRMLEVSKPTNTKILEISATLDKPRDAQALANLIATQTVELSRTFDGRTQEELIVEAARSLAAARAKLSTVTERRTDFAGREPIQPLQARVANLSDLLANIESDLVRVNADIADRTVDSNDEVSSKVELSRLRARGRELEVQRRRALQELSSQASILERRRLTAESLDSEVRSAETEYEAASARLTELRRAWFSHGEELQVMDPGVVPERPSFPNLPLNVVIAAIAAMLGSFVYVSVRFGQAKLTIAHRRQSYPRPE